MSLSLLLIIILSLINISSVTFANQDVKLVSQDRASIYHELLTHSRTDPINDTLVHESWKLFYIRVEELITSKITRFENYYQHLISPSNEPKLNISSRCDESIRFLFEEAKQFKGWAIKSKFPDFFSYN